MRRIRVERILFIIMMAGFIDGCSPRSSPPGPNNATGIIDGAGYVLHDWSGGLKILIVHDTPNGFFCSGEGGTSSPVYHLECDAEANDGRTIQWEIETSDGVTALLRVNAETFNVVESSVFLMRSIEGGVGVEQISRDLSTLSFDQNQILEFITDDDEISAFIAELPAP
jgi:hypothetical protein